jgi:hypothetical protein
MKLICTLSYHVTELYYKACSIPANRHPDYGATSNTKQRIQAAHQKGNHFACRFPLAKKKSSFLPFASKYPSHHPECICVNNQSYLKWTGKWWLDGWMHTPITAPRLRTLETFGIHRPNQRRPLNPHPRPPHTIHPRVHRHGSAARTQRDGDAEAPDPNGQ